jgi:hypothetical protein
VIIDLPRDREARKKIRRNMKSTKRITEKDCLSELERICNIIAYRGIEYEKDFKIFRRMITVSLEKLVEIRKFKLDKVNEKKCMKLAEKKRRCEWTYSSTVFSWGEDTE